MKRECNIILFLFFSLFAAGAVAQPTHYGAALTAGKVIPVNGSRYEKFTPTFGLAADLYWQQDDDRYWTQYWHQPYFGLHAAYAHLDGDLVGDRFELGGLVQAPIYRRLSWNFHVGLSFYTNPYCRSHNEENIFIGSYINALITAGLLYDLPLFPAGSPYVAFRLVHSSNGYLYKPNHGMNYLQLELGLRMPAPRRDTVSQQNGFLLDVADLANGALAGNAGGRDGENRPWGGFLSSTRPYLSMAPALVMSRNDPLDVYNYYFAYDLQGGVIVHPHPCFSYGVNLDAMYNNAHRASALQGEPHIYWGAAAFGESHWGPLTLRLGAGRYLAYYPQNWEQWYLRVGIYYRLTDRQRVGAAMKLHYDHIDFIEWTYMIEL